jgi:glycosyltransferase involved in cell wall biosynthesis
MVSKIVRKSKIAYNLLRDQGLIAVGIRSLEFIQKRKQSKQPEQQKGKIYTHARYRDILAANIGQPRPVAPRTSNSPMVFAWIMPPPGKGSGGHLNIFRFIEFLEKKGYECRIYLYVNGTHGGTDGVRAIMGNSYPKINALEHMQWLDTDQQIDNVDGIFATSWETAYGSYNLKSNAKRFYFVQDFEPYFYPVGGMYSLAENTYKMGFFGVTAGGWLKKKLAVDYGMKTSSFDFSADREIYTYTNNTKRKEIFCYVRPYTERRGFEMSILALDLFHRIHPGYAINLVGWDVSQYEIPFPYNNLKLLEISELSTLYNRCVAGLVLSYTNMSLLPLELLSSGTIPVTNDADNNRLVSDNPFITYSNNDPHSLAAALSKVVSRKYQEDYSKKASDSIDTSGWGSSEKKFVDIIEREMGHHV